MRIYEIKYRCFVEFSEEELEELDLQEGAMHEMQDSFHLGADCLPDALVAGMEYLDETIGEGEWDLIHTKELDGVNVINWPNESTECDCVFCKAQKEETSLEDTLQFQCGCGFDIRVMAEGWENIKCPSCRKEIARDMVKGILGHYFLIDSSNKEE